MNDKSTEEIAATVNGSGVAPAANAPGLEFGELRQIAYVVPDIERAMAHWSGVLGVGPWFYIEKITVAEFTYYGKPSADLELSIALTNSGALQVELIQQRNTAPSLYQDFLQRDGEGAQHTAFWTYQYDAAVARMLSAGYVEGHAGRPGPGGRFAYFIHADLPGNVVEISEQSGGKAELFRQVEQAARGWDGQHPIRKIG